MLGPADIARMRHQARRSDRLKRASPATPTPCSARRCAGRPTSSAPICSMRRRGRTRRSSPCIGNKAWPSGASPSSKIRSSSPPPSSSNGRSASGAGLYHDAVLIGLQTCRGAGASAPGGDRADLIPDQVRKPTTRPTLRWLFQCFEGIDLHHTLHPDGTHSTEILRVTKVHRLVLHLLGPAYENCYLTFQETAE